MPKITFSTELITGNKFNCKVNGVAIAQVTFNNSHFNTMNLIRNALIAADIKLQITVQGNALTILFPQGQFGTITNAAVTGGATQPSTTIASALTTGTFKFNEDGTIPAATAIQRDTTSTANMQYFGYAAAEDVNFILAEGIVAPADAPIWFIQANDTGSDLEFSPADFETSANKIWESRTSYNYTIY